MDVVGVFQAQGDEFAPGLLGCSGMVALLAHEFAVPAGGSQALIADRNEFFGVIHGVLRSGGGRGL